MHRTPRSFRTTVGFDIPFEATVSNEVAAKPEAHPAPGVATETSFTAPRPREPGAAGLLPRRLKTSAPPSLSKPSSVDLFAGKPDRTTAILADGSYIVAPSHENGCLSGFHRFEVFDTTQKFLGQFEATVIETTDAIALTWIDKGELKASGATNFVLWYLTSRTKKPFIEVRNLLNEGLSNHLGKLRFTESGNDDTLRASSPRIAANTLAELEKRHWSLAI